MQFIVKLFGNDKELMMQGEFKQIDEMILFLLCMTQDSLFTASVEVVDENGKFIKLV